MRRTKGDHRMGARALEVLILIALPILFHYLIPVMIVVAKPYSYLGAVLMLLGLALRLLLSRCTPRIRIYSDPGFARTAHGTTRYMRRWIPV